VLRARGALKVSGAVINEVGAPAPKLPKIVAGAERAQAGVRRPMEGRPGRTARLKGALQGETV